MTERQQRTTTINGVKMSHPSNRGGSSQVELERAQEDAERAEKIKRSLASVRQCRLIPEDPEIDIGV